MAKITNGLPNFMEPITCIHENQRRYYEKILNENTNIVMCHAIAGVGKTHISLYTGLELLYSKKSPIERLVIISPNVDVGNEDRLGFLPGELEEKTQGYNNHIMDILLKIVPKDRLMGDIGRDRISFKALNFLRGENFESTYIIVDEAQNTSPRQLKTVMTRIFDDSKLIIEGDLSQCDKYRDYRDSGFFDVWKRMKGVSGIDYIEMGVNDVMRSGIVKRILEKYWSEDKIILNGFN